MQVIRFRSLAIVLLAMVTLAFSAAAQEFGGVVADGDTIIHWRAVPFETTPDTAGKPPLAVSSVTVGPQVSGFPCFGGASGCGDTVSNTVAVPMPLSVIPHGGAASYVVQVQDVSYNGACTISYTLKQGTTKIAGAAHKMTCASGYLYIISFGSNVPAKLGAAKLTGAVVGGTNKPAATLGVTIY